MKRIIARQKLQRLVPRYLVPLVRRLYLAWTYDAWQQSSWSQEGEDRILFRMFEKRPNGFYVDIGAHHPKRFSNTYLFYRKGWRGLNIDAMPGSMDAFRHIRPRDINLECGVGLEKRTLTYHIFNEPALNGFSKELSNSRNDDDTEFHLIESRPVQIRPLASILAEHLEPNHPIDFMSVDVEGFDLDVLRSNDWDKFRPKLVLVEVLGSSWDALGSSEVAHFLSGHGYEIVAKCVNTVFFQIRDR